MSLDYSQYPKISLLNATESALLFLFQHPYLTNENLSLDEGWTRLDPTIWVLRFIGDSMYVYMGVNAFSGKVSSFQVIWEGPSPYVREYNGTSLLSVSEIEEKGVEFFQIYNYSLETHTRYLGPEIEYDTSYMSHYVYHLRFFNVINETIVRGNGVSLHLDLLTGEVVSFIYQWTHVSNIPVQHAVSSSTAEEVVSSYLANTEDSSDYRISTSILLFQNLRGDDVNGYRLVWAVNVAGGTVGTVYVDAVSQEVLVQLEYVLTSSFVKNPQIRLDLLVLVILPPTIVSALGYLLMRRHRWYIPIKESNLYKRTE